MVRRLIVIAVAVLGAWPAPASAQTDGDPGSDAAQAVPDAPAPDPGTPRASDRVAVLMLPVGEVSAAMADALTELLIAAVAARGDGIGIVGKEEFQSQLDQGDAGTVECIESASCLGRVGVQLGVVEIVAGTIAQQGSSWAFYLNRLDVRSGEVLGRVFREVSGDLPAVLEALEESFPELYARRIHPGRLVVRSTVAGATVELDGVSIGIFDGTPVRRETVEPGHHVIRVRAAGHRELVREIDVEEAATVVLEAPLERAGEWTPSPLLWAGGGLGVLALAGAIGFGVSSQAGPDPSLTMRETITGFYPAREAEAIAADVLFGVAAAGAILGGVGLALSGEAPSPGSTEVHAVLGPGTAGVAGSF